MAPKSDHTTICTEHHKSSLGVNKVYPVSISVFKQTITPMILHLMRLT